jgi:hypothetical protein
MSQHPLAQLGTRSKTFPPPSVPAAGYPRPMLRRTGWSRLDGTWELAIDEPGLLRVPDEVRFDRSIEVPFSPEAPRSGVGETGLYKACWYRRQVRLRPATGDERLLLHFGAVDYTCRVFVAGRLAAVHHGGYTPIEVDVTDIVAGRESFEIVVHAEDDPTDLAKPRGKQDWRLVPHSIWYPRTTGIWQSVWLERAPAWRVASLSWTPNLTEWEIGLDAAVTSVGVPRTLSLAVRMRMGDLVLAEDRYSVGSGEVHRRIALSDPGIDDLRAELLWSPRTPRLIDVELELEDGDGNVVDRVESYTALRTFEVDGDRFLLNGRPFMLRMVLDQGYWPETGMTPPDDDAIRKDITLTKAMGFNGVRKHQKIEDPRYLYWADRLGLLVWEEMPSAYRFTPGSVERLTREWIEVVRRDKSHPSIVAWVPFNESWGVPNLPESRPERHYLEAIYHLTKSLDPTRPVVGNDGWESVATDLLGIHDYDDEPARIAARYASFELLPRVLKRERPGGRALVLDRERDRRREHPIVLSEFGGIALGAKATWGYSRARDAAELGARYARLLESVRSIEVLAGFCYTQLTDTYQEANGLLYADRTPKFPLHLIAAATEGGQPGHPTQAPGEPPASDLGVGEREGTPR